MSYFGIKRPLRGCRTSCTRSEAKFRFATSGEQYQSVGTRLLNALETGADIGDRISPVYDEEDSKGIDITCSPNTDIFDIAEEIGVLAARSAQEQLSGKSADKSEDSEENSES